MKQALHYKPKRLAGAPTPTRLASPPRPVREPPELPELPRLRETPAPPPPPPLSSAEVVVPPAPEPANPPPTGRYSLYILPENTRTVTEADLLRFPPTLLGEEAEARQWLTTLGQGPPTKKKRHRVLSDLLFYVVLACFVLGVFLVRGAGDGAPVTFMGFSAMRVLTASMGEEIPQGSLIITRHLDPTELKVGDDITYLAGQDTTITHRIIEITEHYGDTGERAFVTQGVANPEPDSLYVLAANVVGKVIFHNLALGKALYFIREHWVWLLIFLGLLLGLYESLRIVFQESGSGRGDKKAKATRKDGRRKDGR